MAVPSISIWRGGHQKLPTIDSRYRSASAVADQTVGPADRTNL